MFRLIYILVQTICISGQINVVLFYSIHMMYRFNGRKISEGINQCYLFYFKKDFKNTNLLIFHCESKAAVVQGISSSKWCIRSQVRSHPVLVLYFFSYSISPENSGSVKNCRGKACIYLALVWEIFSRRGPLSSGVIMCMYRNFTVRLVTVCCLTLIWRAIDDTISFKHIHLVGSTFVPELQGYLMGRGFFAVQPVLETFYVENAVEVLLGVRYRLSIHPQRDYYLKGNPISLVFQNIDPPPPLRPASVYPCLCWGVGHTRRVERGVLLYFCPSRPSLFKIQGNYFTNCDLF